MRKREMSFIYDADKMAETHNDEHNTTLWIIAEEALKNVGIEVLSSSDKPYLERAPKKDKVVKRVKPSVYLRPGS